MNNRMLAALLVVASFAPATAISGPSLEETAHRRLDANLRDQLSMPENVAWLQDIAQRTLATVRERYWFTLGIRDLSTGARRLTSSVRRHLQLDDDTPPVTEVDHAQLHICGMKDEFKEIVAASVAADRSAVTADLAHDVEQLIEAGLDCFCSGSWDLSNPAYGIFFSGLTGGLAGGQPPSAVEFVASIKVVLPLALSSSGMCSSGCQDAMNTILFMLLSIFEKRMADASDAVGDKGSSSIAFPSIAKFGFPAASVSCICSTAVENMPKVLELVHAELVLQGDRSDGREDEGELERPASMASGRMSLVIKGATKVLSTLFTDRWMCSGVCKNMAVLALGAQVGSVIQRREW